MTIAVFWISISAKDGMESLKTENIGRWLAFRVRVVVFLYSLYAFLVPHTRCASRINEESSFVLLSLKSMSNIELKSRIVRGENRNETDLQV